MRAVRIVEQRISLLSREKHASRQPPLCPDSAARRICRRRRSPNTPAATPEKFAPFRTSSHFVGTLTSKYVNMVTQWVAWCMPRWAVSRLPHVAAERGINMLAATILIHVSPANLVVDVLPEALPEGARPGVIYQ